MESRNFNTEAERSLLGCMILSSDAIALACAELDESDFVTPAHAEIFGTIKEQYARRQNASDIVVIVDALKRRGTLDIVGGFTYLANLSMATPGVSGVENYISILRNCSTKRKLAEVGKQIAQMSEDASTEAEEALATAQEIISQITTRNEKKDFIRLREESMSIYDYMESMSDPQKNKGLKTGFADLDRLTGGLHKAELIVVAARPSMGKSSFVMNVALHAAVKEHAKVAMFSLEDSHEQLEARMTCAYAMVDMQKVKSGNATDEDWGKILEATSAFSGLDIFIDDSATTTMMDIRSKCRRIKAESGLDLVTIDYLQLMGSSSGRKDESRVQQISEITRSLKALARELDVPVIVLSQLNRSVETRPEHKPLMSDLRESGSIEQDADTVMFLYRPAYYDSNAGNEAELSVAKQRNGPTGIVNLYWLGQYTRFMSAANDWQQEPY